MHRASMGLDVQTESTASLVSASMAIPVPYVKLVSLQSSSFFPAENNIYDICSIVNTKISAVHLSDL